MDDGRWTMLAIVRTTANGHRLRSGETGQFHRQHMVYCGRDRIPKRGRERGLMSKFRSRLGLLTITFSALLLPVDAQAQNAGTSYRVETTRWRAADGQFARWQFDGLVLTASGALRLD